MSNMQFRLSINRKSFPWEDVVLQQPDIQEIANQLYQCTTLDSLTTLPAKEIKDLYAQRIADAVLSDGREVTVLEENITIDNETQGLIHLTCVAKLAYGSVKEAKYNYSVMTTRWGWKDGAPTYTVDSPCVVDVVIELRFMEP